MGRFLRSLRHGVLREIKRLTARSRRKPAEFASFEEGYTPAFDPTLPTRASSYGPYKRRRRFRTQRR